MLGGIGNGTGRSAMQSFSFTGKANLAFIEVGEQYFSINGSESNQFKRTLSSLSSFFSKNQEKGN